MFRSMQDCGRWCAADGDCTLERYARGDTAAAAIRASDNGLRVAERGRRMSSSSSASTLTSVSSTLHADRRRSVQTHTKAAIRRGGNGSVERRDTSSAAAIEENVGTPTNVRSRLRHRATGAGERRITTTVCSTSLCDYHAMESSVDRGAEISLCAINSSLHTTVQCHELCYRNTSTVVRRSPACRTVTKLRDVVERYTAKQQWKKHRI